jgi:outer membrane protein OmpA-like peptidoglycan-associated protein
MRTYFNHGDGDDSTWKIVYMDMITVLMILFLSLWILDRGQTQERVKKGDVTLTKVQFEADDYFDPGKAQIKTQAREQLEQLFFQQKDAFPEPGMDPEAGGRRIVIINGHTDDQGEKDRNLELGFERAMAVYQELKSKVPKLAQNVGICSYADNFPVERVRQSVDGRVGTLSSKRRKNRRFEIVGEFEDTPELFEP